MEYQNTDEATRREACEQVKKIADAIKKIRKKYYLCFNKMSDADKQKYDELKVEMQNIAQENGLNKLSAELISDIDTQYSEKLPNYTGENGTPSNGSIEDAYKMYLKAVQLQAEFTVLFRNATDPKMQTAYMKRAQKIQAYVKKLSDFLEKSYSKFKLMSEKGEIFSEKFNQKENSYFNNLLKFCYELTSKDPLTQNDMKKNIEELIKPKELNTQTPQVSRM